VNVAGIFILVRSKDDLWIYILLLALTALFSNISIYTQLHKYVGKPAGKAGRVLHHLKGSMELFFPQVASLFYLQVDKVMLEWMTHSTRQISFYDQAEKIVTIPLSLITVISTVVMPRLANEYQRKNGQVIQEILLKAGRYAMCLAMPMMLGMFCVARQFIPWYLGSEFLPTATAIMILSPIVLLNSLTGISGKQYFTATNQMKILLGAYVTAAVMNVVVNAMLIPGMGYKGAAIATVLSSSVSVLIQYHFLMKQVDIRILWKWILKYFGGALVMAAGIFLFTRNMSATVLTTCLQVILSAGIYYIFLIVVHDQTLKEGMAIIKGWLYKKRRIQK
jgi:O-antigen/teichoic acid export membrane protein